MCNVRPHLFTSLQIIDTQENCHWPHFVLLKFITNGGNNFSPLHFHCMFHANITWVDLMIYPVGGLQGYVADRVDNWEKEGMNIALHTFYPNVTKIVSHIIPFLFLQLLVFLKLDQKSQQKSLIFPVTREQENNHFVTLNLVYSAKKRKFNIFTCLLSIPTFLNTVLILTILRRF